MKGDMTFMVDGNIHGQLNNDGIISCKLKLFSTYIANWNVGIYPMQVDNLKTDHPWLSRMNKNITQTKSQMLSNIILNGKYE